MTSQSGLVAERDWMGDTVMDEGDGHGAANVVYSWTTKSRRPMVVFVLALHDMPSELNTRASRVDLQSI
jgi:hypothetical protein